MPITAVTALRLAHLGAYAAVAAYLAWSYPGGHSVLAALLACGAAAELMPRAWHRFLLPEALFAAAALTVWIALVPGGVEGGTVHAFAGMLLAWWCLLPARAGFLRWLVSLVLVELVLVAALGPKGGIFPAAALLVPLALLALAADSWLAAILGARASRQAEPFRSWWIWALQPAAVCAGIALLALPVAALVPGPAPAKPKVRIGSAAMKVATGGLSINLGSGGAAAESTARDATIRARLLWEGDWSPGRRVYLRALALGRCRLGDGRADGDLLWEPDDEGDLAPMAAPITPVTTVASLVRMAGGGDVVMHPDAGDEIGLDGLLADPDGNFFRRGLGQELRVYQVSLDGSDGTRPVRRPRGAYLEVPRELEGFAWEEVEEQAWRNLDPEIAADAVVDRLHVRCSYAVEDLPRPPAGPGGSLRGFLFSRDAAARRGHCQFFASACALLLRRAGHPARCVVGYASEEVAAGSATFRNLHAHAWVEFADRRGRWHRVEATPPAAFAFAAAHTDPASAPKGPGIEQAVPLPPERKAVPLSPEEAAKGGRGPIRALGALMAVVALAIVWVWWRSRRLARPADPRLAAVQARADDLLRLAAELGVRIGPATTVSRLCDELTRRTGVDLAAPREAWLRARYDRGPLPPPWPAADLRAGARMRSAAAQQTA